MRVLSERDAMTRPTATVVEEFAAGVYLLVACIGIAGVGWVQVTSWPRGGSFLVVGLSWLAALAAVWAALVVLAVNLYRYLRDERPARDAATFALITPLAFGAGVCLALLTPRVRLGVLVGGFGVVGSVGLVATVLGDRVRGE